MMTDIVIPYCSGGKPLSGSMMTEVYKVREQVGESYLVAVLPGDSAPQVVRHCENPSQYLIIVGDGWPGWNYRHVVTQIALSGDERSVIFTTVSVDLKELGYEDHAGEAGGDQRSEAGALQPEAQDEA